MKFKWIALMFAAISLSCSLEEGTNRPHRMVSTLKSDVLLQSIANKPFARPHSDDQQSLTLSGASLLKSNATFKVINAQGREIHCETFPATELIQPEYKTANSVLQEAHLRDVVKGYFLTSPTGKRSYAGL